MSRPVPVRIYVPEVAPLAVIAYFHGGGFVTGTIDSYDSFCRRLANRVPATVVSVGYRRAPEHMFPAAVEDAEAAARWVGSRAAELSGSNAFAIAGDSAGGNLATVVSRRLREPGDGEPALQILLYPFLDLSVAAHNRRGYRSYEQYAVGYGLTLSEIRWYARTYVAPAASGDNPDASPVRAAVAQLQGLPAAYILTAECDVLRDEAETYADRLRRAGVVVELCRWDGHIHGFLGEPSAFDAAEAALHSVAAAVHEALARVSR